VTVVVMALEVEVELYYCISKYTLAQILWMRLKYRTETDKKTD